MASWSGLLSFAEGSIAHVSRPPLRGGSGEMGWFRSLGASPKGRSKGRSGRQTKSGASRSELVVARKHVPDRVAKPAGNVDLSDLRAPLLAESSLVALVALSVVGVLYVVASLLLGLAAAAAGYYLDGLRSSHPSTA